VPVTAVGPGEPDRSALLALTAAAFPDEELRPLVARILDGILGAAVILAGEARAPEGYAMLSPVGLPGGGIAMLLGPVAVHPDRQGEGLGRSIVAAAIEAARGSSAIFVLGDPGFYGPLGFEAERAVLPPYPPPGEWDGAWQSVRFAEMPKAGSIALPAPWDDPALWAP